MITPNEREFEALAAQGYNLIPVWREIAADLETPVSAFLKVARGDYTFLLESVQGGEKWGRYTFLGSEPAMVLRGRGGRLDLTRPGRSVEVRSVKSPLEGLRDVMLTDTVLIFDNVRQTLKIVANVALEEHPSTRAAYRDAAAKIDDLIARLDAPARAPRLESAANLNGDAVKLVSNQTREGYMAMVEAAKEYIAAGDVIQVVPSQRFEAPLGSHPFNLYRSLRTINPSPYMFYLQMDDHTLVGASPEVMVRVEGREITLRPIAGTRRRGATEAEDRALERELLADPKERAEHVMLVDLGRNDVGRVAEIGSVEVTELMTVERYSHVMHIVSNVRGRLREGCDAYDAFRATFPQGTVSGAPKIRAMEIIDELEPVRRGVYAGAVGYFSYTGNTDTAIALRTILVKGGRVYIQAGGGVVADSDPAAEYEESVNKARAMVRALSAARAFETAGGSK